MYTILPATEWNASAILSECTNLANQFIPENEQPPVQKFMSALIFRATPSADPDKHFFLCYAPLNIEYMERSVGPLTMFA